jgi:hypothetical protein
MKSSKISFASLSWLFFAYCGLKIPVTSEAWFLLPVKNDAIKKFSLINSQLVRV